ncbi:MAG: zinc ribbon domain-containing protein [bacterium]|nr:zinc ribbon domain-containing protein [bacterium]
MGKIDICRSRLANLTVEGSPEKSLEACRSRQKRLRSLKREVLAQLLALRIEVQEQTQKTRGPKPSLRELWERRDEGARELLADVKQRVTGLLDEETPAAIEAYSEINEEIDARLAKLTEIESRLAGVTGEVDDAAARIERRLSSDRSEDHEDDDLYAAVGAAVKEGPRPDAFCSHCGQGIEPDDRFCRRCGHRL